MSQLAEIAERRRAGGFNARELVCQERHVGACYQCRKFHPLRLGCEDHDYADFACRHLPENGCICVRLNPNQVRGIIERGQRRRRLRHDSILNFTHNASILEAFQSADQSLDLTSLNSLASSATAGWGSQAIDNSSNLYLDYLAAVTFALVNTAPGNNKVFNVYAATSLNTTDLPTTGAASSNTFTSSTSTAAALTYPDYTANAVLPPLIRVIPYVTQNVAIQTPLFSTAFAFGGWVGRFLWYGIINHSGMTIAASSNAFKYRGIYSTVA